MFPFTTFSSLLSIHSRPPPFFSASSGPKDPHLSILNALAEFSTFVSIFTFNESIWFFSHVQQRRGGYPFVACAINISLTGLTYLTGEKRSVKNLQCLKSNTLTSKPFKNIRLRLLKFVSVRFSDFTLRIKFIFIPFTISTLASLHFCLLIYFLYLTLPLLTLPHPPSFLSPSLPLTNFLTLSILLVGFACSWKKSTKSFPKARFNMRIIKCVGF